MARAQIQPPRYVPEPVDDDTQKPGINPDGSPQTVREMLSKGAAARTDSEEAIEDARRAQTDAHIAGRARLQAVVNDNAAALGMLEQPNSTATEAHKEPLRKTLAKAKAKVEAYNAKDAKKSAALGPTLMPMLRDFLQVLPAITNGRGVDDAGTTDTLPEGRDMTEHAAAIKAEIMDGRAALKRFEQIPPTRDEVKARLRFNFGQAIGLADSRLQGAAGVHYDPGRYDYFVPNGKPHGSFNMWGYQPPSIAVANGLGDIVEIPNAFATIAAVMGDELIDLMADKALAKYGDQPGITMAERTAKRLDLETRLLELERLHAFWVYAAREEGIRIDHVSDANPFAVLDVVIRK